MTYLKNCQWIGDGECCGNTALTGRSYCNDHIWRVYAKGSNHGKRKKDIRVANSVHTWESLFNEALEELESEGFDL
jgi:hypothetical protein